jgi:hypothetical protein
VFYTLQPLVAAWKQMIQAAAAASSAGSVTPDGGQSNNKKSAAASGPSSTLLHDLIDVSREALAAVSDLYAKDIHSAIAAADGNGNVTSLRAALKRMDVLIVEMDTLLGSGDKEEEEEEASAFLLETWVGDAMSWGHTAEEKALYCFNAKYQLTGWSFHYAGQLPGTGDYAAKMWHGLLSGYYRKRWALYGQMAIDAITAATGGGGGGGGAGGAGGGGGAPMVMNATAWAIAEDNLTDTWARDCNIAHSTAASATAAAPSGPSGDPVALSQAAYSKYSALLLAPPPPPPSPPAPPSSNSTPAGYTRHVGGYWKGGGMRHGGASAGHTIQSCAAACTEAKARPCVAFELSATEACYMFSSMSGDFIKNTGCRTFIKKKRAAPATAADADADTARRTAAKSDDDDDNSDDDDAVVTATAAPAAVAAAPPPETEAEPVFDLGDHQIGYSGNATEDTRRFGLAADASVAAGADAVVSAGDSVHIWNGMTQGSSQISSVSGRVVSAAAAVSPSI